jgi:hypothetical protein
MQLSEEMIREYIKIYKEDFGYELTVQQASGSTLTKDSTELADVRVWRNESRC